MSDHDKETKTEEATGRQREKFRKDGKVATSKDVISVAVLVATCAALYVVIEHGGRKLLSTTSGMLGGLDRLVQTSSSAWTEPALDAGATLLVPVALAGVAGALAVGFTQTKGLFSLKVIKPNFNFANPLPKLKKMFISKEAATTILQSAGKVVVILAFTAQVFWNELKALVQVGAKTPIEILAHTGAVIVAIGLRVVPLLVIFAVIDWILNHRRMEEQMKMSMQEVKDEHKLHDGDPEVKRRQRRQARELATRGMLAQVPQADVVLVNPTHYSVALVYDAARMPAPAVVAKGKEELAARIREIARGAGIPVVHNPPLTRNLYAEVEVGCRGRGRSRGFVAEVLAYVYRLKGRAVA